MIPTEIIEQIRDAADLVQLIGEYVELKRTGSDYRGPCPFHGGTHRNFSVVPKKQMYHCFVCHESGDVFTFWMKKFGLDYPSAVREIAGRVGVTIPETRQAGPDPNEPLYSALGVAAEWFARRLRESEDAGAARAYLEGRHLAREVWDEYQLGYAPASRDAMLDAFRQLGLAEEVLLAAGLALRKDDGSVAPRFRGRLVFPIKDVRSRVVGFGGRILGDGEPKYLNSPEGPVFHKGTLLYGLDRARGPVRTEGFAVVVEGYVDCIRLQTAGIGCAVAPLGTALTAEQARVLRRYTREVVLAYDADAPGLKSTFRAGDELLRQGATVKVVTLPAGDDPDTLVQRGGAAAFRELLGQALDVFERKIQLLDRKGLFGTLEGRRRALDRLLPSIRAASDPLTRELYVARAAERCDISSVVLARQFQDARDFGAPASATGNQEVLLRRSAGFDQERDLVRLMMQDDSWVARGRRELSLDLFRNPVHRRLTDLLWSGVTTPPDDVVETWQELLQPFEGDSFDAEGAWNEGVAYVTTRPGRERQAELDRQIGLARPEEAERLFLEKQELKKQGKQRHLRKALGVVIDPVKGEGRN